MQGGAIMAASVPNTYAGPGDIVTGAWRGWWGFRAFSRNTTGTPAVRLQRASDSAQQDIYTKRNGDLDDDQVVAFAQASALTIAVIYDQSGNNYHLTPDGAAVQIPFTRNVLGGKGCLDNSAVAACCYAGVGNQHWWNDADWSMFAAWRSAEPTGQQNLINDIVAADGFRVEGDIAGLYSSGFGITPPALHDQFHAGVCSIDQTATPTSFAMVDGVGNAIFGDNSNAGEASHTNARVCIFGATNGTLPLEGYGLEAGWAGPISGAGNPGRFWTDSEAVKLIYNTRCYWGF